MRDRTEGGCNIMGKHVSIPSTGLSWTEDRLAGRYDFLRRRREEVRLDLLYYPYWSMHLTGSARWRIFGEKPLEMLLISDARTGTCRRVSSFPQHYEERLSFMEEKAGFSPAEFGSETEARSVVAHMASPLLDQEEAEAAAETFALAAWNKRCNLPLGPRADIRCTRKVSYFLYKPFWVMRPKEEPQSGSGKIFLFDASTGLGGVSEYWSVVEYVRSLQESSPVPSESIDGEKQS